jgi:hypothetical protein
MACLEQSKPDKRNLTQEYQETIAAQRAVAPEMLALEQQYQPAYARLAAETLGITSRGAAEATNASRGMMLDSIMGVAPQLTEARQALDPQSAELMRMLNEQAAGDLALGGQLSPEQERMMQQASRAAFAARGLSGSNMALADEMYRIYDLGNQQRRQRQGFAQGMVGLNQQWAGDPFTYLAQLGQGNVGMGQSMMPGAQFNPESAYAANLYNTNKQIDVMFNPKSTLENINNVTNTVRNVQGVVTDMVDAAGGVVGAFCWVAREVFGASDPRWQVFRAWLHTRAPAWLWRAYRDHGEAFAGWLKRRTPLGRLVRPVVRWLMQGRINSLCADRVAVAERSVFNA